MIGHSRRGWILVSVLLALMGCATPPPPAARTPVAPAPAPAPAPKSYVVLMENADGSVGKLAVSSGREEVLLERARTGVDLDGTAGKPYAVDEQRIKRDFGEAMAAQPPLPASFMLYFKTGGTVLTDESRALIPAILDAARSHPAADVSVIGHTDTAGSSEANEKLGLQRAQSVAEIIQKAGLRVQDLTVSSHGEKNLLVVTPDNTSEPRNRRVEITVR
jgi:outer membrane protein OmpA-like peptidoglycan-associated protein